MTKKTLKITLVRSTISSTQRQKDTAVSLGLRKMNRTVEQDDTPAIRGMINKISHLVSVEEVES